MVEIMWELVSLGGFRAYPRVDNDLLILAASRNRSPSAPVAFCLFHRRRGFHVQVPRGILRVATNVVTTRDK